MNPRNDRERRWLAAYLKPLKGARIQDVHLKVDEEGVWPVLRAVLIDGDAVELEISRDEEGNGPGFVFGLPFPSEREVGK